MTEKPFQKQTVISPWLERELDGLDASKGPLREVCDSVMGSLKQLVLLASFGRDDEAALG